MKDLRISEHFSLGEFYCKCGCDMPADVLVNILKLVPLLELIRNIMGGRAIKIVSGYRCFEHNKLVGGASHSQHLLGNAANIIVYGRPPRYVHSHISYYVSDGLLPPMGLGSYHTFTHVDNRGYNARWYG